MIDYEKYWRRLQAAKAQLDLMSETLVRCTMDIIMGRIKDGWPTRDAAAPEEDC